MCAEILHEVMVNDGGAEDLVFAMDPSVMRPLTLALIKMDTSGVVLGTLATEVSTELDAVREDLRQKYPTGYSDLFSIDDNEDPDLCIFPHAINDTSITIFRNCPILTHILRLGLRSRRCQRELDTLFGTVIPDSAVEVSTTAPRIYRSE